jgi:hypothetical protein
VARPPDARTGRTSELESIVAQEFADIFGDEEAQPAKPQSRTAELQNIVAEEFADIFGEPEAKPAQKPQQAKPERKPSAPRQPKVSEPKAETAPERTIGETAKSAATETIKSFDDAVKGLAELFGGTNRLSANFTFDEETYRKAKPMFEAAVAHAKQAIKDVRAVVRQILTELKTRYNFTAEKVEKMLPYITQFVKDFTAQTETQTQTETKAETKSETKAEPAKSEDTDTHRVYKPASQSRSVDTLVPVNMATATENALARLEQKVGSLDDYVAEKLGYDPKDIEGYFSAEQVDALAMAIDNIEKGAGYIIGDQTGLGKGRVVAGIIRYAMKNGKTPIFVTEKPTLYGDMIRDLTDIGMPNVKPLITNADESVPLDDEAFAWAAEADRAREAGKKPPPKRGRFLQTKGGAAHTSLLNAVKNRGLKGSGHDVVFTTYNQMQKKQGESAARHDLLERLSEGGVVIFDESHNAGGGQPKVKDGEIVEDRARFARALARKASAVFYSSATYAKRPNVMDLYFKTDLSKAVDDITRLPDVIQKGGIPLQQVTAAMLTEAGQYIRRERSFKGVNYDVAPAPVNKESAETVASVFSGIAEFDRLKASAVGNLAEDIKASAEALGVDTATNVESSNFTAIIHNVVDQMLLNLKVDAAVKTAVEALKRGEKPVITVANTMGSFLEKFTTENDIKSGDPINVNFGGVLDNYLERSRRITIKNPDKTVTHHYLTDEELGPAAVAQFKAIKKMIQDGDFSGMAISPIDSIHQKLRDAGYTTAEITGRNQQIDYSGEIPIFRTRPAAEASTMGKKRAINGFNDGSIDVLIINQSGSTGISLHASEKFKNQNRRHMIIAQAEKNVDTHMQMLGRVHRTGQVVPPRYTQLAADIPAEKRPAAVLAKKMASLNANTTAARGSAVTAKDVVDFLNEFGDQVAFNLMREDQDLWLKLGQPRYENDDGGPLDDAMRKVTGRIPLLPIEQQEAVYKRLEDEYKDFLALQESMGKNTLEAKTLDLQAETLGTEELSKNKGGDSPFTQSSVVEKVKVKRLGKPMSTEQVTKVVREALGEESGDLDALERIGDKRAKDLMNRMQEEQDKIVEAEQQRYQNQIDQLQKQIEQADDTQVRGKLEKALAATELRQQTVKANARTAMLTWRAIVQTLHPGAPVQLKTDDGIFYGIVTNLDKAADTKNPVALSGWRVNVAVADAARAISFPLSQVTTEATREAHKASMIAESADSVPMYNPESESFDHVPIAEAFDKGQTESTETRNIVTGNILAGFAEVKGKGQIVNYTDKDGNVKQGILMPKNWDREKELKSRDVTFKTADQAIEFVGVGGKLKTRDGDLILTADNRGNLYLAASKAKGKGGRYYTNKRILNAIGNRDFVSAGGVMRVGVSEAEARKVFDLLASGEAMGQPVFFLAENQPEKAREIVERDLPKAGAQQAQDKPQFILDAEARLRDAASGKLAGSGGQQVFDFVLVQGYGLYKKGMSVSAWAKEMVDRFGEKVRPYLRAVWNRIQETSEGGARYVELRPRDAKAWGDELEMIGIPRPDDTSPRGRLREAESSQQVLIPSRKPGPAGEEMERVPVKSRRRLKQKEQYRSDDSGLVYPIEPETADDLDIYATAERTGGMRDPLSRAERIERAPIGRVAEKSGRELYADLGAEQRVTVPAKRDEDAETYQAAEFNEDDFIRKAIEQTDAADIADRLRADGVAVPESRASLQSEATQRRLREMAYRHVKAEMAKLQGREYAEPKWVTDARKRLRQSARGERAGSGGQQLADIAIVTGWKVYKAGMEFADWAQKVIENVSEKVREQIRPHLNETWQQLQTLNDWRNGSRAVGTFLLSRLPAKAKAKDALPLLTRNKQGNSAATNAGVKQDEIVWSQAEAFIEANPDASISDLVKAINKDAPRLSVKTIQSASKQLGATTTLPTDSLRMPGPSSNYREVLVKWDNPPEGVEFKKREHYGDEKNILFDTRLEDRQTTQGDNGLFFIEGQSDWQQATDAPPAPLKSNWQQRLVDFVLGEAEAGGYDGIILPRTAEQVAEIQRWGRITERDGKWYTPQGYDVTPIVKRYIKEMPKEFEKRSGRKLETRVIDVGRGDTEEIYFLPNEKKTGIREAARKVAESFSVGELPDARKPAQGQQILGSGLGSLQSLFERGKRQTPAQPSQPPQQAPPRPLPAVLPGGRKRPVAQQAAQQAAPAQPQQSQQRTLPGGRKRGGQRSGQKPITAEEYLKQYQAKQAAKAGQPPATSQVKAEREAKAAIRRIAAKVDAGDATPAMRDAVMKAANRVLQLARGGDDAAIDAALKEMERAAIPEQTRAQKIGSNVISALSLPRAVMASADLSAPLRQGAILTLPPQQWKRAALSGWRMLQAAIPNVKIPEKRLSFMIPAKLRGKQLIDSRYEGLVDELNNHPDAVVGKKAGLFMSTDPDSGKDLTGREEDFISKWTGKIPIVKESEQAYKTYLDSIRLETFRKYKRVIDNNPKLTPGERNKAYQAAANWINVASGRGSLGQTFDKAMPAMSTIFFAPRYTASRIQVLNPLTYAKNVTTPAGRAVFKQQMGDLFQFAAVVSATLALAAAAGADIEDDPESPDFLKIKVGDTRYDNLAGLQQLMRLYYRLGKDAGNAAQGVESKRGQGALDIAGRFGRSKLAPVPSYLTDMLTRRTFIGEKFTPGKGVVERVIPLMWRDMVEAYQKEGTAGAAKFTPGFFGIGVQDYSLKDKPAPLPQRAQRLAASREQSR